MAKLRKWCAYRTIERPYTRWSKARKKAFVKSRPGKKVIKYDMGNLKGGYEQFNLCLKLVSKELGNVRANAIEAARITSLKRLESTLGRSGFYYRVRIVPHHVLRENALAAGAGADRLSTGMKHSFGKTIGTAAKVEVGKILFEVFLPKENEEVGRGALKAAGKKLPLTTTIIGESRKAIELTEDQKEAIKAEEAKMAAIAAKRKADEAEKAEKAAKKEE